MDEKTKKENATILEFLSRYNVSGHAMLRMHCYLNGLKFPARFEFTPPLEGIRKPQVRAHA